MIELVPLTVVMGVDLSEVLALLDIFMISLFSLAFSAIFILEFYEFISTRDIFKSEGSYHSALSRFKDKTHPNVVRVVTALEYLFLFPLIVFFWAAVFFVILVVASEAPVTGSFARLRTIFILSVSIVGAVRICAYYRRKIAEDLSKLLPLVLVGNFLIRETYMSFSELVARFEAIGSALGDLNFLVFMLSYFILLVVLEFLLRIVLLVKSTYSRKKKFGRVVEEDVVDNGEEEDEESDEGWGGLS